MARQSDPHSAQEVCKLLISNIQHAPTRSQSDAASALAEFLTLGAAHSAFLLKGYAGTGKTTLIAALVRTLRSLKISFEIMAPTGRAAKVVSSQAQWRANTIHRSIYSLAKRGDTQQFRLRKNTSPKRLYIIDESSMLAAGAQGLGLAAQESVLDDLTTFIRQAPGALALFVGDTAQLPPVQETLSEALDPFHLSRRYTSVREVEMRDVVRQAQESGILHYATSVRQQIEAHEFRLPRFSGSRYPEIRVVRGSDVQEAIEQARTAWGAHEVAILCRSNKRAIAYNHAVRQRILLLEDELVGGERLLVCRNSYFWTQDEPAIPFIANGDYILLHRVYNLHTRYGMRFAEAEFTLEDYADAPEVSALVMLDVLHSPTPALAADAGKRLFEAVHADLWAERGKPPTKTMLRNNRYLNALQIKYGYAATCHKAQGGQWAAVFIDFEIYRPEECSLDQLRWIYTALTRATERVYLIAPPKEMLEMDSQFDD